MFCILAHTFTHNQKRECSNSPKKSVCVKYRRYTQENKQYTACIYNRYLDGKIDVRDIEDGPFAGGAKQTLDFMKTGSSQCSGFLHSKKPGKESEVCCCCCSLCRAVKQWFLTFVTRMFLNCSSQKPQPAQLVMKASGSCSPKLLSNPRLRTSDLANIYKEVNFIMVKDQHMANGAVKSKECCDPALQ